MGHLQGIERAARAGYVGQVMRRTLLLVLLAIPLAVPAGASAEVHGCNHHADFNVLISSARNISCTKARAEMRRYKGSIRKTFSTPRGFRCRRVSGGRLGGQWRCAKGRRAFRFEFGD
jgi:hypothetical protein